MEYTGGNGAFCFFLLFFLCVIKKVPIFADKFCFLYKLNFEK